MLDYQLVLLIHYPSTYPQIWFYITDAFRFTPPDVHPSPIQSGSPQWHVQYRRGRVRAVITCCPSCGFSDGSDSGRSKRASTTGSYCCTRPAAPKMDTCIGFGIVSLTKELLLWFVIVRDRFATRISGSITATYFKYFPAAGFTRITPIKRSISHLSKSKTTIDGHGLHLAVSTTIPTWRVPMRPL